MKNFAKFIGENQCWEFLFDKAADLKEALDTGITL